MHVIPVSVIFYLNNTGNMHKYSILKNRANNYLIPILTAKNRGVQGTHLNILNLYSRGGRGFGIRRRKENYNNTHKHTHIFPHNGF